jgi:hypothetical protein
MILLPLPLAELGLQREPRHSASSMDLAVGNLLPVTLMLEGLGSTAFTFSLT